MTKKKGFTIVELVIVIAVIGILSAVLIPTFAGLVNKANKTALQENLRNAYTSYASNYDYSAETPTLYSRDRVVFTTSQFSEVDGEILISSSSDDSHVYIYSNDGYIESDSEIITNVYLGEFEGYYAYALI